MFLNYLALAILLLGVVAVFYTFIYIHDIPYEIAKHRNHPHAEAIGVAGWLSLFTLHAIWPIVFIWAVSHKRQENGAVSDEATSGGDLNRRLGELESKMRNLEKQLIKSSNKAGIP